MLIAMWSGPRNISTAMMRSWENRADTSVIDEPFYGYYLKRSGVDHPMAADIIDSMQTDPDKVIEQVTSAGSDKHPITYQKHITTHMLDELDLGWTDQLVNCFLIRDPKRVVASYAKKRQQVEAVDLGFSQQLRVFNHVSEYNAVTPIAIDSDRFLQQPETMLKKLCEMLDIRFEQSMLRWPAGRRDTDGIWAAHWYDAVERSTGFMPWKASEVRLTAELDAVADECQAAYQSMLSHALPLVGTETVGTENP